MGCFFLDDGRSLFCYRLMHLGVIFIIFFAPFINPLHYLGLLAGLIGWVYLIYQKKNSIDYILNIPLVKLLLVLLVVSFIYIFYAEYTYYALRKWSRILQAVVTYLIMFEIVKEDKIFIKFNHYLITFAGLIALHGLLYYFYVSPVRISVLFSVNTRAVYFLLLVFLPLSFAASKKISLTRKLWYTIVAGAMVFNVIITKTRGAWLGLVAGFIIYGFLRQKKILALIFIVLIAIVPLLPEGYISRANTIFEFDDPRIEGWEKAWHMLTERNVLLGVGPGNYHALAQYEYDISGGMRRHTHNLIIQFIIELGLFGFIYIVVFITNLAVLIHKIRKAVSAEENIKRDFVLAFSSLYVAFLVHTLTHLSIHNRSTAALAMFILACFAKLLQEKKVTTRLT